MSSVVPSPRLGWRLLPAVVAAAVAVIAASVLIATLREHPIVTPPGSTTSVAQPAVAVATKWRTWTNPVGAHGKLPKRVVARYEHQKDRLRTTVHRLVDALVIEPGRVGPRIRSYMTGAAGAAIARDVPAPPKQAADISALKRHARIRIQAPAFRAASAQVRVVMAATIEGRRVRWRNDFTFWLRRASSSWRVFAFDMDRAQT